MSTQGWVAVYLSSKIDKDAAFNWCVQNFGAPGFFSGNKWVLLEHSIQFKNQQDAAWFKLKWVS